MGVTVCCIWYALPAVFVLYIMHVTRVLKTISQMWFAGCMDFLLPVYNNGVDQYKKELFSQLKEKNEDEMTILEIGVGSGGSLDFYPEDVPIKIIAVEPNVHCKKYLERNLAKYDHISLEKYVVCHAENMKDIESNSIETVISTIVLCSVEKQSCALNEIKRVLKPGGKFYFMEHVVSERGTWLHRFQHLLNSLWYVLFDGCNITRDTANIIQNAGFAHVEINRFMANTLSCAFYPVYPHISGYAVKRGE